jgi:drug/metabolite transporter (DMT)-like permease
VSAVTLGLLAALVNTGQGFVSKDLTKRYPARPMVGVLLAMNCLLLLWLAPFVDWVWSPTIIAIHVAAAVLLVASSVPVWDLFDAGATSATLTAQAMSPLAAVVGVALFLPGTTSPGQILAAIIVVVGVTWALADSFRGLGRRGTMVRVVLAAIGAGGMTVTARMLADEGVGVVETYVVRTGLSAVAMLLVIPPRGVPVTAIPQLLLRSVIVTIYFTTVIIAVQEGSPVVVQTMLAISPLLALGVESVRSRTWPSRRALGGAGLVVVGVALVLVL